MLLVCVFSPHFFQFVCQSVSMIVGRYAINGHQKAGTTVWSCAWGEHVETLLACGPRQLRLGIRDLK